MRKELAINHWIWQSMRSKAISFFLGFLLVIVGLEIVLRLMGFGYKLIYRPPRDIGADFKILCVGESTTWGIGASDPIRNGYPRQLEEMLKKKYPGKSIQCLFDQTIGQNTSEILLKLPQHIKKYQPNLIIFMVGANNWWNMDRSNILLFNNNESSRSFLRVLIFLDRFRVWKLLKSLAFSAGFYKERWNYWFPKDKNLEEFEHEIFYKVDEQIFDRLAEHDIEEMAKICKVNKIKMIMCSYPMGVYSGIAKAQRKFGDLFVDNYERFKALSRPEDYLSADHWHPNDKGYTLVAANIYNVIVQNRLIEE